MFYVYVLECSDGSLYAGYTNDVKGRLKKHSEGKGGRYTRSRLPIKIVACWNFKNKSEAMKTEAAFKKLSRKEKLERVRKISI